MKCNCSVEKQPFMHKGSHESHRIRVQWYFACSLVQECPDNNIFMVSFIFQKVRIADLDTLESLVFSCNYVVSVSESCQKYDKARSTLRNSGLARASRVIQSQEIQPLPRWWSNTWFIHTKLNHYGMAENVVLLPSHRDHLAAIRHIPALVSN